MIGMVLVIVLGLFGFSFTNILITTVLITGVSFVAGDLYVLPRFGNTAATILDFVLAFGMVWLLSRYMFGYAGGIGAVAVVSAIFIGVVEAFFHRYMQRFGLEDIDEPVFNPELQQMQTEFAEEPDFKKRDEEKSDVLKEKEKFYNE